MYQQVVEPRRLLSQQAYKIKIGWDFNKLLLQQQAVAAGCCCSVLLYYGDESAPPNKWGTVYAHNGTSSSVISRVEDSDDITQHMPQRIELIIILLYYTFHIVLEKVIRMSLIYTHTAGL